MDSAQIRRYPPIGDYAYISDCHSSALISRAGSIDWCCMPRIDSPSCFGRLLDWQQGGFCRLCPADDSRISRSYLPGTLVLSTVFSCASGEARLLDFFPMRKGGEHRPYQQIIRILEGIRGEMSFCFECAPCFDYGTLRPWIREFHNYFMAVGGHTGLLISADFSLDMETRHRLAGCCNVGEGQRRHLSILYAKPEDLDDGLVDPPSVQEMDRRLERTIAWWRKWSGQGNFSGPDRDLVLTSAMVLKGLTNAPTGAIAAAATTSIGESPGGIRNWDYRYSWVRDSSFSVRALAELGYTKEADGLRRFVERTSAGSVEKLQIVFGVGGERRLPEIEINELEGYRGTKPVRIGNAAETQFQHDVYGELLDLAWVWHRRGASPDDDYWEFLVESVNAAARQWRNPDRGIWEWRGEPRHFVLSKVMCWVALERGIRLAEDLKRKAPLDEWQRACRDIRAAVEQRGYDSERGIFIQAFDYPVTDAALLLLPLFDFIDACDERMVRTVDAIRRDLSMDGLLLRYRQDELEGQEGVFLACSFWLAECLAAQGKQDEALTVYRQAVATGNDLGLFAEEYAPGKGEMLGNFPQGLTHLSLIAAAVKLGRITLQ